jgi:hypothetical protein
MASAAGGFPAGLSGRFRATAIRAPTYRRIFAAIGRKDVVWRPNSGVATRRCHFSDFFAMHFIVFLRSEAGVVTIDWTVLLAALTGAGLALMSITMGTLSNHSQSVRGELQDPHFNTDWVDNITIPQPPAQ